MLRGSGLQQMSAICAAGQLSQYAVRREQPRRASTATTTAVVVTSLTKSID